MPASAQKESDQVATNAGLPPKVVLKPSTGELFATFLRIGVTAFGGPAMIAFIRKRVVAEKKWISPDTFQSGVALCQAIPGATVMQMAGYIGLQLQGVRGAIASFVGFGLPAFLLMLALSAVYSKTHELPTFVAIFSGLQAVIVGVVANAAFTFGKASLKGWRDCVIAVVAAGLFGLRINPLFIIAASALLGLALNHGLPQKTPTIEAFPIDSRAAWDFAAANGYVLVCPPLPSTGPFLVEHAHVENRSNRIRRSIRVGSVDVP